MILDKKQQLYHYGFIMGQFKETENLSNLMRLCEEIRNKETKPDYNLIEKYQNTLDLKPSPIDYDECFLSVLKENNIDKIFEECTGNDFCLSNLQVRTAYPNKDGKEYNYMPWHRDNYIYKEQSEKPIGPMPPGFKLNFYPDLDNKEDEVVGLIPGSHLQIRFSKEEDYSQKFSYTPISFKSSKNTYIIFNTSLMHGTLPTKNKRGNLRILYNFVQKIHLQSKEAEEINKKYKDFINE